MCFSARLDGERIALLPIDDRYYRVYFAAFPLARFDSHTLQMERLRDEDRAEAESGGGNGGNLQNQGIPTFPPPGCFGHGSRSTTWSRVKTVNHVPGLKGQLCFRLF